MFVQQHIKKILISGLVAGALAFASLCTWGAVQEIAGGSGEGSGSPKIATIGADREMTDRD
ncbi:MAG: hypothetical protein AAGF95_30650 [Chloroflexota bacterium]